LTGIWRYRVLRIGQPHPFFQLPWARHEGSGSGRRHESMQLECSSVGSKMPGCRMRSLPILLGLPESRISWRTEERWKSHSGSPDMLIAGQRSSMTDAVSESLSKTWSGFSTDREVFERKTRFQLLFWFRLKILTIKPMSLAKQAPLNRAHISNVPTGRPARVLVNRIVPR
jgi:hypothetical protein